MQETLGEIGWLIRPLVPALESIASVIDLIGIAIVLVGFVRALFMFLGNEYRRFRGRGGIAFMHQIRIDLGNYILVGIEFMIASDIIHTVLKRQLIDLAFVSALVVIRTAISYFLGKEIVAVKNEAA